MTDEHDEAAEKLVEHCRYCGMPDYRPKCKADYENSLYCVAAALRSQAEAHQKEVDALCSSRCKACIEAEREQIQCIVCEGPFSNYDEPCHSCFVKQAEAHKAEVERLKQVITAIMGRCADLLDSDQFNNLEALVDVEPTFNGVVENLQAELADLRARLEVAERERDSVFVF